MKKIIALCLDGFSCFSVWALCLLCWLWALQRRVLLSLLYLSHLVFMHTDKFPLSFLSSKVNNHISLSLSSYTNPLITIMPLHWGCFDVPMSLLSQGTLHWLSTSDVSHQCWAEGKDHSSIPPAAQDAALGTVGTHCWLMSNLSKKSVVCPECISIFPFNLCH